MKIKFYVVFRGRKPGLYRSWPAVVDQIERFDKPYFRKYKTLQEAEKALQQYNFWKENSQ
jgi:ribonuclease HI